MKKYKKLLALIAILAMVVNMVIPVYANDEVTVITWGESGEAAASGSKNSDKASIPYLALGADLSQDQLMTVLNLMGLVGQDLSSYNIVYITNAMEHQYLDEYVDPSVIGTRALSSVLVRPAQSGHGVQVTTQNINYCTSGMYKNALLTAGVENADIMVVGPTSISGTAALIGALKAYEEMTGEKVSDEKIDTALDELVTTGEIAEAVGDSQEIEDLIAFVKAQIAGKNLNTEEEIEAAVREAVEEYGASLTDEEIDQIVKVMIKIKDLGIDYNTLLDQAEDLYKKFGDKLSLDDLEHMSSEKKGEIVKIAVGQFFTSMLDGVKKFFAGLFGK